ncbi:MAG: S-layer homology domain-containing protein [Clostridia bacterium]|nr:S-layer homology domain-containing protein [Clostridia bacterium]
MKKIVAFILALFVFLNCSCVSAVYSINDFATRANALGILIDTADIQADLSVLDKFSDADRISDKEKNIFAYCVGQGLLKGYPDGTLQPYGEITRGEYAVIIERLLKDTMTPKTVFDFDIKYDDGEPWCESALNFCSANLLMLGYGNDFGINDNLTDGQLNIIKKRFGLKPSCNDICTALILNNLDELDYDAVMWSGYDEILKFTDADIPKQSYESKVEWANLGENFNMYDYFFESLPADFKYYCALNTQFNTAFDFEKYTGNDAAILRLSSRKSFLECHSTAFGVNTPLFDEGGESLSEKDRYVSEITDKIRNGVKVKAFFVPSTYNYFRYDQHFPGIGTKNVKNAKGYEYFKYISGAPEGMENGKWYRRVVKTSLSNGETYNTRYTASFDVKYEEEEPVPECLLKKE